MPLKFPKIPKEESLWRRYRRESVLPGRVVLGTGILLGALLVFHGTYSMVVHHISRRDSDLQLIDFVEKSVRTTWAAFINPLVVKEVSPTSALTTIRVHGTKNSFDYLDKQILEYQRGILEKKARVNGAVLGRDGKLKPVKISYRGSNGWHHKYWKPSLRLKTQKNDLFDGMRDHILIAPEDGIGMRNWLSTDLARQWGLIHNGEHFVRLFINERYRGVYTRLWRYDESLLIRQGRLPGPFFRFESGVSPAYNPKNLNFSDPAHWEISGVERAEGEQNIAKLIAALDPPPTFERFALVDQVIDQQAMAKYLAILAHASSFHVEYHNIAFWLNTTSGKLEPVITDPVGYPRHFDKFKNSVIAAPPSYSLAHWMKHWFGYPQNLQAFADALRELLRGVGSTEAVFARLEEQWRKIQPDLKADVNYSSTGHLTWRAPFVVMPTGYDRQLEPLTDMDTNFERLKEFVRMRNESLVQILNMCHLYKVDEDEGGFQLLLEGYCKVASARRDGRSFNVNGVFASAVELRTSKSMDGRVDMMLPFASYVFRGNSNEFLFKDQDTQKEVPFLRAPASARAVAKMAGLNPLAAPSLEDVKPDLVLGPGMIEVAGWQEYGVGQKVTIRAGTEFRLGSGASLVFRGPLEVRGTRQSPVRVRPLEKGNPFGVFAVLGDGQTQVLIDSLDIAGGSVARRGNLKLSGMLSLRKVHGSVIQNSRVGVNFVGDDGLHVVASQLEVFNSTFEAAHSDAIDFDQVDGRFVGNHVVDAGNDCLDISMGEVLVRDSQLLGCGDKGISAGEGSKVFVQGSRIERAQIGVAAKDRSQTHLKDVILARNVTGWAGYRKKWRWEFGGTGWLSGVTFMGSTQIDISGDKHATLLLENGEHPTVEGKIKITHGDKSAVLSGWRGVH